MTYPIAFLHTRAAALASPTGKKDRRDDDLFNI